MDGDRTDSMLNDERLASIRRVLEAHSVSFAMLFGSAAHGTSTAESDIDLAVEFDEIRPTDEGYSDVYLRLLSELEETLSGTIDVVDVHSLSPRFARAVFDSGMVIVGDEEKRDGLEGELATDSLSVDNARERVAAAVEQLKEDA